MALGESEPPVCERCGPPLDQESCHVSTCKTGRMVPPYLGKMTGWWETHCNLAGHHRRWWAAKVTPEKFTRWVSSSKDIRSIPNLMNLGFHIGEWSPAAGSSTTAGPAGAATGGSDDEGAGV